MPESYEEKIRQVGLILCSRLNIPPYDVQHGTHTLMRKFSGPVWTYFEYQRDEDGNVLVWDDAAVTKERRILVPMDVYTEVLEFLGA